jgi:cytochrome c6
MRGWSARQQASRRLYALRPGLDDAVTNVIAIKLSVEEKMQKLAVRIPKLLLALPLVFLFAVPTQAQDGAALYKSKCATCHGVDGKGDTPVGKALKLRDLGSGDVQKQTDEQLTDITAAGKGKMPAYKDKLTAEQIKQLVAYMRTFKKK